MEIISPASYNHWFQEESPKSNGGGWDRWTAEENKLFENALAIYDKDTPERWHNVAAMIPGKSVGDVVRKYKELVYDVKNIEAGLVPLPGYTTSTFTLDWVAASKRSKPLDHERKKGVPWTEEEHKLFLMGLKKYGKGDWRNISRNFVVTRTPTQVASHAQKYFIRQLSGGKDKRRASIHDITTVNLSDARTPSPSSSPPAPSQPSPATAVTGFQWNHQTGGAAQMGFQVAPYGGIGSYGLKIQGHSGNSNNNNNNGLLLHRGSVNRHDSSYFGPQSMVFQMQSAQHYPHG